MPLFYSHDIDANTRLAVWYITEQEDFFLEKVPLSRSITHPHKRLQHLAGRYLLQYLFPELPIHLIQIASTRQPFLATQSHHFSISHSGNYAAAIVSTCRRVGVDVEEHGDKIQHLQHKFLNEHEQTLRLSAGPLFPTIIWSAKEAMYKWYSLGEIDFQQHLQVKTVHNANQGGLIEATLFKQEPVEMQLPFKTWDNLVLTWVCL